MAVSQMEECEGMEVDIKDILQQLWPLVAPYLSNFLLA
jgi:hypothetical protein